MEHGKASSYFHGCRCDACRAAGSAYAKQYRQSKMVRRICPECGQEFVGLPDSHYSQKRRPNKRFCSKECAGTTSGSGARPVVFDPAHPLAGPDGRVAVHRKVLLEKIGPGTHPCHWCQRPVTWKLRRRTEGGREFDLMADHLDGNCRNNDPANLVPACSFCNVLRGWVWKWERMTNRPIAEMSFSEA